MSKLEFDFEIVHKISESKEITKMEILQLVKEISKETIFGIAGNLRDDRKGLSLIHI